MINNIREFWPAYLLILLFLAVVANTLNDTTGENGRRRDEAWTTCRQVCGEHPVKNAEWETNLCECDSRTIIRPIK
jgi:hypothetical protein